MTPLPSRLVRCILETCDLRVLGRQIVHCVEDQEYLGECAVHARGRHVANCDLDWRTFLLLPQFGDHRFR